MVLESSSWLGSAVARAGRVGELVAGWAPVGSGQKLGFQWEGTSVQINKEGLSTTNRTLRQWMEEQIRGMGKIGIRLF